jgi:regulatory protein
LQIDLREKARNYAFLLLKFRPRSEQEIRQRLQRKNYDPQIIRETLIFLKEHNFIDDHAFTDAWINYRLKRPFGLRRIEQELRLKGIEKGLIQEKISQAKKGYCELETVEKLARERLKKLKNIEPQKARARIYAYLMRRGFSPDAITEAVNRR